MKKINFRNPVQAALFTVELSGQISDGMWENSKPRDHWKPWCEAEVGVNPSNLGRNFWAQKDNYNFASSELLDCVGDRMLNIANMAENNVPALAIQYFNDYDYATYRRSDSAYWVKQAEEFDTYFESYEVFVQAKTGSYDMKKLRAELNDMKLIIRQQINP